MPYHFEFRINDTNHVFPCDIATVQCIANKRTGDRARCLRNCAIGTPYCYSHLLSEKKLRIKQSTNPRAGSGLFAQVSRSPTNREIVFRKGDLIIEYTGETIDFAELTTRYDLDEDNQYTAPYAYEIRKDESFIDAACVRGVAALANHKGATQSNAKFVKTRGANGIYNGVKLVATENIRNNREIFASYGNNYRLNEPTTHRTTYRRRN